MTGWIEISLTLRRFVADPEEVAALLRDSACEIRRAGNRINNVSPACFKDNSVRREIRVGNPAEVPASIRSLFTLWGGAEHIYAVVVDKSVEFVDFDIAVFAAPDELISLGAVFIEEDLVQDLATVKASISLSVQLP
jgi:hypothetical protein